MNNIARILIFSKVQANRVLSIISTDLGYNIHIGDNIYAGYNCTILNMVEVRISDHCMIGPNVGLYTAGYSIEPKDRNKSGYAIPINNRK